MKFWQKASLGLLGITSAFLAISPALAVDCPLLPQTPYKSKENPAVYYINRACTKRPFTKEAAFFAYFSSWKQVRITTATILKNIPNDPKGPMSYTIAGPLVDPVIPPLGSTKPIIEEPSIIVPIIITAPTITPVPIISSKPTLPTPSLSGVMAEFLRCPTDSERTALDQDFNFMWGKDWTDKPFTCDYNSTLPNRLPIYATLRLLKNLQFSKPLPFTGGQNLYSYLIATKLTLNPGQNCAEYSTGWNYVINLGGTFAHTHAVKSGSATCELSGAGPNEKLDDFVYNPIYKAGTLVHEAHHAINGSRHTEVNGGDQNINDNSAWAAQFYFYVWLNQYSDTDQNTKSLAKNAALDILNSRFSENKCPSDADLKAAVNALSPNLCP